MKKTRLFIRRVLFCSLLAVLALPGTATANDQVATVKNFGDALVFQPLVEFERLVLTVTGPCNFEDRQVVTKGEPVFRLNNQTIDGRYRFELVVIPSVDPGIVDILKGARQSGDNSEVNQLCRDGKLPGDPLTQAAGFLVDRGEIVFDPGSNEKDFTADKPATSDGAIDWTAALGSSGGDATEKAVGDPAAKDFVINDDLIVDGSACIGFDCVNGEVFSFDTIRLKENNLRIKFDDTSVVPSFPANDWQLTANDSANGGASKFSIEDVSGGRTPFTVEANARSHSLYVDDGGRIGSRTSTPSVEIHTIDGDTPTLRLQQDGSSGFEPQTWDVAGNETNFFIRDVTNGSTLPFRIRPSAPSNAIFIDVDGDVGLGTSSPAAKLHVENTGADNVDDFVVTSDGQVGIGTDAPTTLLEIETAADNGGRMRFEETATGHDWEMGGGAGNTFVILDPADGSEFTLNSNGDLTIAGTLTTGGPTCGGGCDEVFDAAFELESIEAHAAQMWQLGHLPAVGPVVPKAPINLSEMAGNMLNELEKAHIYIEQLNETLKGKDSEIAQLSERLARLEELLLKSDE